MVLIATVERLILVRRVLSVEVSDDAGDEEIYTAVQAAAGSPVAEGWELRQTPGDEAIVSWKVPEAHSTDAATATGMYDLGDVPG